MVSDAIYPYNKGGKEKRMFELSTRLAKLGHDVHIYTMHWWKTPEKDRIENSVTLHAISPYYDMYHGDRRSIKEGIMFALHCFKLFNVKFDVLDVDHMPFFPIISAWIVCVLTGRRRKFYGTWHEALSAKDWTGYMGKSGYIASIIEHICTKLPYRISVISKLTSQNLSAYHHRSKRVEYVACGIDTKTLNKVRATGVDCDVLYVGRLVKDKNVDKLIEAIAIVKEKNTKVKCVIIGHGVEKDNLEKLVTKLKLSNYVTILNPLPEAKDVYAYMKKAKVFVLPSAREGFGIVALEALGCGTPVVTTNAQSNAAKDLIEDGKTGSIVELTPQALAYGIEIWLEVVDRNAIAKHVTDFDWDAITSKLAWIYLS